MMVSISGMKVNWSFAEAQDLLRLAQMTASRRGSGSLENICAKFDVSHRTAHRMPETLDATLKAKQRAIREGFAETMGLRAHRAISWIGRAEVCGEDDDACLIFLWITFNAAYVDEGEFQAIALGEELPSLISRTL